MKYKCAKCGLVFESGWSDEEAVAELEENFAGIPKEDCAIVCDDCYKEIMGAAPSLS